MRALGLETLEMMASAQRFSGECLERGEVFHSGVKLSRESRNSEYPSNTDGPGRGQGQDSQRDTLKGWVLWYSQGS
jgi:hypothetical protein